MDDATRPVAARDQGRRLIGLALALVTLAAGYTLLFKDFYHQTPAVENVFQEQTTNGAPPLEVYLEVVSVDPVRQAVQIRLDFATRAGPDGRHFPGSPATDLVVHLSDGNDVQDVELQGGRPTSSRTLQLEVMGALENYPLDRDDGRLWVRAFQGKELIGGIPAPIRLTTWEDIAGWEVVLSKAVSPPGDSGLALTMVAQRPNAQIFFALLIYAAMILIAASGLTISGLVFVGARKIEATLTSALGAMVFAVPALRNALPGSPPLGLRADAFVFLWVQLALIIALALFIATWARRGPQP